MVVGLLPVFKAFKKTRGNRNNDAAKNEDHVKRK
jgi:hypothetical protein